MGRSGARTMRSFFKSSSSKEKAAKEKAAKEKAEKEEAERLKNEAKLKAKEKEKAGAKSSAKEKVPEPAIAAPGKQDEWPEAEGQEGDEGDVYEWFLPTEFGVFPRGCVVEIVCGEEGEEERWLPASVLEILVLPGKEHLADEELQPADGAITAPVALLRLCRVWVRSQLRKRVLETKSPLLARGPHRSARAL